MPTSEPIKVIFMSNSPTFVSGYAKVIREVCQRLGASDDFKVWVVGEQYMGMPINYGNFILMARRDGGTDLVNTYLEQIKPDYFIWLEDTFTMYRNGVSNFKFPSKTKFVPYIPHDGEFIPTTGHEPLKRADLIVPMANFTKEVTEREGFKCTEPIYHGVDSKNYSPPTSKEEKIAARNAFGMKENDFIVLYFQRPYKGLSV